MERSQEYENTAWASPVCDAQEPRLAAAISGRRLPCFGRARPKKIAEGVGSLNVRSMTGRSREVADLMKRRKINILCVQDTRWRGNKAIDNWEMGTSSFFSRANKEGREGVGVVLNAEWKKHMVNVNRCSNRVMSIKLMYGKVTINIISAYAPQVGCSIEEKEDFWEQMDAQITWMGEEERIILGGDLNGHVGRNRNIIERTHGGWGVGERNEESENVVDFAVAFDMAILNTFYKKQENQMWTYCSAGRKSQIDLLMCRRNNLKEIKNFKVINGESVAPQHRLIVIDFEMKEERRGRQQQTSRIKWWMLKDQELKAEFKIKVLDRMVEAEDPDTWWTTSSRHIIEIGEEVCGKTSGKDPSPPRIRNLGVE
ncbi:craniofacial development protein 2-like [Scylla paramamosain]|uniref:craniofacial development protein 2-like n=1 Tax=Scylla paramamosain TaxID=85552 RepID=UPI00308312C2